MVARSGHVVEAVYETPLLAHATMEPCNATVHLTAGRLHNHGIKAAATADRYRGIAAAARGKRQFDVADAYDKLAAEYSAAETFAAERAQSWHDRGGQHSTKARDADAPPVLEDDSAQTKTRSSLLRSK